MSQTNRLPLIAITLATVLGLALAGAADNDGQSGVGTGGVAVAPAADDGAATDGSGRLEGLSIVDPGAVTDLAAAVLAATTTTTTTTAPPPPPTTAVPTPRVAPAPAPAPAPTPAPAPAPAPAPSAEPASSGSCAANFGSWMNSYRSQNGVAPLTIDSGIGYIPGNWSMSMARNQNLAHNPNYVGQVRSARPQAGPVGENVGYSYSDRRVFDNMVASSGHRAAILSSSYTHGVTACAVDAQGKVWVAVDFWG